MIFVVDDEVVIWWLFYVGFLCVGYCVVEVGMGCEMLLVIYIDKFGLVFFDFGLFDCDGFELILLIKVVGLVVLVVFVCDVID